MAISEILLEGSSFPVSLFTSCLMKRVDQISPEVRSAELTEFSYCVSQISGRVQYMYCMVLLLEK